MTPRQRDVYLYIRFFWSKYGYGPSYLDIAIGLELNSKSNVARICKRLMEEGLLERKKFAQRDIKPKNVRMDRLLKVDRHR